LIEAAIHIPHVSFLVLGAFQGGGTREELEYRDWCINLAVKGGAQVRFPFGHCNGNEAIPWQKEIVNGWINQARLGVLTASMEGHNRFKMECLAADRPVLVAKDAGSATQKHVNEHTGWLFEPTPSALADAIVLALGSPLRLSPRQYVLAHSGRRIALARLKDALRLVCERAGQPYHFEDVDWDGRNENFTWGEAALTFLMSVVDEYRNHLSPMDAPSST
jgi:hypothetical protein